MVITPTAYSIKRLRTILAYKYIEASYTIDNTTQATLFLPIDSKYSQIVNFKAASNLLSGQKFNYVSVGTNLDSIDRLTNDTVLWYEQVDGGQIFDTKLQAYSVNIKYERPKEYSKYFHVSNLEGLYVYFDSIFTLTNIDMCLIYEDLDCMA